MKSCELVGMTLRGENPGRTPVYGWLRENLSDVIAEAFGSVEAFEDYYEFDMAHLFGGPAIYSDESIAGINASGAEVTPEVLLQLPMKSPDNMEDYKGLRNSLEFYKTQRERFCYVQTNGFFECYNAYFGIENHLMYLALYPEKIKELYNRQAEWNKIFAEHCIELGIDMIHMSDDWGAQKSLMFSPDMFRELIFPYHKDVAQFVKQKGAFVSLHSDGCISSVLNAIANIGYDALHPYQETAGMSYNRYLKEYADRFAIFGGLCVQSTLGFGDFKRLESEIRRVFGLLKGKRFLCCTTHFVQNHCSIEELVYAYDLIAKLRI